MNKELLELIESFQTKRLEHAIADAGDTVCVKCGNKMKLFCAVELKEGGHICDDCLWVY